MIHPRFTKLASVALAFSSFVSLSARANVLGIFPAGARCKSAALESAIDCDGTESLLYNPALLTQATHGVQGELGVGHLDYSYEHPDFDPVRVTLFTPVASAGWRDTHENTIAWGFSFVPTSMANLKVHGLPQRVDGKMQSLDVHATRRQFHAPFGAAWSPDFLENISFGGSLMITYDDRQLTGVNIQSGEAAVDVSSHGIFFRPVVGGTWHNDMFAVGTSFMGPLTKHYKGKSTVAGSSFDTEQVDYDPAMLEVGARVHYADYSLSLNVNRLFGQAGADKIRDGIDHNATRADVRDVNQLGVRAGWQCSNEHEFSLAAAWLPSIWGAGYYYKDDDGHSHREIGDLFGTFNAVPVRNQSVNWQYTTGDWKFNTALFRSAGTTTTTAAADNTGHYQIAFVSLTTGLARAF